MILQKRYVNSLLNGILTYQNIIVLFGGGGVKAVKNTVQLNYINVSLKSPLHISRGRFYVRNLMRFSNL